jgi:hypothetical protein
VVRERLGITPDEIDGDHCVALSRPRELADRLDAYCPREWTSASSFAEHGGPRRRDQRLVPPLVAAARERIVNGLRRQARLV